MPAPFRIVSLPAFERDVRRRVRRNPHLLSRIEEASTILREDPQNVGREHNIRKLTDVKQGEGQWRIRVGDYRLRYDIIGRDVVLYSFKHRRESY